MIHDAHISPLTGELMDGVDTHAHLLDGFLQNRLPKEMSMESPLFLFLLVFVGILSVSAFLFLPNITSPLLAIFLSFFIVWISRYIYFHQAIVLEIFPLLCVGGLFSFPVTFIYRFFILDGEKRKITSAFSHYVDPTVVKQISDNAKDIYL